MASHSKSQSEIREQFEENFGYWIEEYDWFLDEDPEFLDLHNELFGYVYQRGELEPKIRELILVALNANTSQLYPEGTRRHMRRAFEEGATAQELLAVLELSTAMGLHSITVGAPILEEEQAETPGAGGEEHERIKEKFIQKRGYWSEFWDSLLELDAGFLDRYINYSAYNTEKEVIDPKTREFIWIAIDISTTHLYREGTDIHIENALDEGATIGEIMELMEIATFIGGNALSMGVPILVEEMERAGRTD